MGRLAPKLREVIQILQSQESTQKRESLGRTRWVMPGSQIVHEQRTNFE